MSCVAAFVFFLHKPSSACSTFRKGVDLDTIAKLARPIAVLQLVWSEEQSLSGFFISGAPSE